ncbi:sensor histidine kinase [Algicola sagamiensis]|uniref:sensor histidine kinase n=1 Tax=Algicola sagamiensis TaxID=163869 RepID=UPI00037656A8|nr:ATP-binding protein [Algicola sagamiensis]
MRIATLNRLLLGSTLAGFLLISGIAYHAYNKVTAAQIRHEKIKLVLVDIEHTQVMLQQWYVTIDLFFANHETYLLDGLVRQASQISQKVKGIEEQLAEENTEFLEKEVNSVIALIRPLAFQESEAQVWENSVAQSDRITSQIISQFDAFHHSAKEKGKEAKALLNNASNQFLWVTLGSSIMYIVVILLLSRWSVKLIVHPIQILDKQAQEKNNKDDTPSFIQKRAPDELLQLSESIQRYVSSLNRRKEEAYLAKRKAEIAKERFAAIMRFSPIGIFLIDSTGMIESINPEGIRILEADDGILGSYIGNYFTSLDQENHYSVNQTINHMNLESVATSVHQTLIPVELHGVGLKVGGQSKSVLLCQDISDRKKHEQEVLHTQEKLFQSEKLASVGQLAAGISHELNNPLGYIISNLGTLSDYFDEVNEFLSFIDSFVFQLEGKLSDEEEESRKKLIQKWGENDIDFIREDVGNLLHTTEDGVFRLKQIISDFQGFSDSLEVNASRTPVDFNQLIQSVISDLKEKWPPEIRIVEELRTLPYIESYPERDKQVIEHLLMNAMESIEDVGSVKVTTNVGEDKIYISVEDTGAGIPPENMKQIFDPFFTTRPIGEGKGLGLHIAKNHIQNMRGHIEVESELGKGTRVTLELPLEAEPTG